MLWVINNDVKLNFLGCRFAYERLCGNDVKLSEDLLFYALDKF